MLKIFINSGLLRRDPVIGRKTRRNHEQLLGDENSARKKANGGAAKERRNAKWCLKAENVVHRSANT